MGLRAACSGELEIKDGNSNGYLKNAGVFSAVALQWVQLKQDIKATQFNGANNEISKQNTSKFPLNNISINMINIQWEKNNKSCSETF